MTDLETLEVRIADLEATVEAQQDQIDQLQTDLEQERQARHNAEARVDDLETTIEEQSALLDALRKRTDTTQSQLAELQARELEKGAHLQYDHVTPTQLDVPDDRLERFTGEDGTQWVRLPDHEDPLDRGPDTLPAADLLPIQQLARMDEDALATATRQWSETTAYSAKPPPPSGAATSPRPPTAFLANWTALLVKREIFDMDHRRFPASSS